MFLWVKLILFILDDLHFQPDVEKAVNTIPEGLPALYSDSLQPFWHALADLVQATRVS